MRVIDRCSGPFQPDLFSHVSAWQSLVSSLPALPSPH